MGFSEVVRTRRSVHEYSDESIDEVLHVDEFDPVGETTLGDD